VKDERARLTKSVVEDAALAWLEPLGYAVKHGPDITPSGDTFTLVLPEGEGKSTGSITTFLTIFPMGRFVHRSLTEAAVFRFEQFLLWYVQKKLRIRQPVAGAGRL
jgi:hypothetical protein